jgi:hypothetical protein
VAVRPSSVELPSGTWLASCLKNGLDGKASFSPALEHRGVEKVRSETLNERREEIDMSASDNTRSQHADWVMLADSAGIVARAQPEAAELAQMMQGLPGPGPEIPGNTPVETSAPSPEEMPGESPEEHPDSPPRENPDDAPEEVPQH